MTKFNSIITKAIIVLFVIFFSIVILDALFFYTPIIYTFNPIILAIGIIVYFSITYLLYKKVIPKVENNKFLPYILIAIFYLICITVSYLTRLYPKWDMGQIYSFAVNSVQNGIALGKNSYLYSYPHNLMITLIWTGIIKIASYMQLSEYVTVLTIFNSMIATLMVTMMYKITKKLYDNRKAILLLIILIFTSPIYLHASIYYTDLISAFLAVLVFYIYIMVDNEKNYKLAVIKQILLGIVLFIGVKIKMTVLIVYITILIIQLLKGRYKKILKNFSIPIIICIIFSSFFTGIIEPKILYIQNAMQYKKIPIEHWIMMGLKGNGTYSEEDLQYTNSFSTYNEKKIANRKEIVKRMEQYNIGTFLVHLNEKIKYAWTDGTYFSIAKIRNGVLQENVFYRFIIDDSNSYKYLPQIMHISMLSFILIYAYYTLKIREMPNEYDMVMILSIIGIFTFLLIWENRSRYIFTMVPFLLILQLRGFYIVQSSIEKLYHHILNKKYDKE